MHKCVILTIKISISRHIITGLKLKIRKVISVTVAPVTMVLLIWDNFRVLIDRIIFRLLKGKQYYIIWPLQSMNSPMFLFSSAE